MPDPIKDAIARRTATLVSQAAESRAALQHNGLYGENNEGLLIEVLRALLPHDWSVDSGEIVDVDGNRSPQCDIIIHSRAVLPPIYVGPTQRVIVAAHAVGAVVEVKSTLHSSQEVTGLWQQLSELADFVQTALAKGDSVIGNEGAEQSVTKAVEDELSVLSGKRVTVFGFAFEARPQEDTIKDALPVREWESPIFVLDVPRPWSDIKTKFSQLGATPTRDAVEEFIDHMREPNGFSFDVETYVRPDQPPVHQPAAYPHSTNALGVFVKEISDRVRRQSPIASGLSARAAEIVYSAYHKWAGAYT